MGDFLLQIEENRQWIEEGNLLNASLEELEARNHKLYEDILPDNYEISYANPQYAVGIFETEMGQFLAALYAELRSLITVSFEGEVESLVIRIELFLEIYGMFLDAAEEGKTPELSELKETYFWFACDYIEDILEF